MSQTDIVIMSIGAALIIVGLVLFVLGKKDGSQSNVEGFGIKLNVSNPSIMLIVFGIGLLLVPRILPEQSIPLAGGQSQPSADTPIITPTNMPTVEPEITPQQVEPKTEPAAPVKKPAQGSVFLPTGQWALKSYNEAGVDYDVPSTLNGSMQFTPINNQLIQWQTNVMVYDFWGNIISNSFRGEIRYQSGGYQISFTWGTAADFVPESFIPLELQMDSGNILHMKYTSHGSEQLIHWKQ